jgi:U4/U6 small nuclear ribonucleoprotein PRP3
VCDQQAFDHTCIRIHLHLPAPPQVKISNLMRVLGEEATMDPTAIEQQVRQQMEERSQVGARPHTL